MDRSARFAALAVLVISSLGVLLGACRESDSPSAPSDAPAHRIVSLSPPFTETIFALGRGDRLVGRTAYCDAPAEATSLPVAGDAYQARIETLVALDPDLVVTNAEGLLQQLGPLRERFRVRHIRNESVDEVLASIETLGRIVEAEAEAAALVALIREAIDATRARVADRARPRVLIVHDRDPFYVAGTDSYVGALLEIAGGDNVIDDLAGYPKVSPETLVARRPDILIDATHGTDLAAARSFWSRFPEMPAVREGRVHVLDEMAVIRPGPRIPEALRALEALLHSEDGR